jgi:hypothetical protein
VWRCVGDGGLCVSPSGRLLPAAAAVPVSAGCRLHCAAECTGCTPSPTSPLVHSGHKHSHCREIYGDVGLLLGASAAGLLVDAALFVTAVHANSGLMVAAMMYFSLRRHYSSGEKNERFL